MEAQELRSEIKRIHKEISKVGWKSEEGKLLCLEESSLYKNFLEEHGEQALIEAKIGKQTSFGKLQNSKGNGFGNY